MAPKLISFLRAILKPKASPEGEPLIIGGERVGTRVAGGVIVLSPGYGAEQLDQHQLPDSQPYQDQSGNIAGEAKDVL